MNLNSELYVKKMFLPEKGSIIYLDSAMDIASIRLYSLLNEFGNKEQMINIGLLNSLLDEFGLEINGRETLNKLYLYRYLSINNLNKQIEVLLFQCKATINQMLSINKHYVKLVCDYNSSHFSDQLYANEISNEVLDLVDENPVNHVYKNDSLLNAEEKRTAGSLLDAEEKRTIGSLLDAEEKRTIGSLLDAEEKRTIGSLLDAEEKRTIGSLLDDEGKRTTGSLLNDEGKRTTGSLLDDEGKRTTGSLLNDEGKRTTGSLLDDEGKRTTGSLLDDEGKRTTGSLLNDEGKRTTGSLLDDEGKRTTGSLLNDEGKRTTGSLLDDEGKRTTGSLLDDEGKRTTGSLLNDEGKRTTGSLLDDEGKRTTGSLLDDEGKRTTGSLLDDEGKRTTGSLLDDEGKRTTGSLLDDEGKRTTGSLLDDTSEGVAHGYSQNISSPVNILLNKSANVENCSLNTLSSDHQSVLLSNFEGLDNSSYASKTNNFNQTDENSLKFNKMRCFGEKKLDTNYDSIEHNYTTTVKDTTSVSKSVSNIYKNTYLPTNTTTVVSSTAEALSQSDAQTKNASTLNNKRTYLYDDLDWLSVNLSTSNFIYDNFVSRKISFSDAQIIIAVIDQQNQLGLIIHSLSAFLNKLFGAVKKGTLYDPRNLIAERSQSENKSQEKAQLRHHHVTYSNFVENNQQESATLYLQEHNLGWDGRKIYEK